MTVNGISEALGEDSSQSTLDLLVSLGVRLRVCAQSLDDLSRRLAHVGTDVGIAHNVATEANAKVSDGR